ncbi:hypothetical protein [Pontibacter vulgaris]|uniref:hypothetical protein n=1 Tax=Pontibacter vulgaris TaxID=2905679 RepID=UPI001FA6FD2C|nr:hypothetical protein [Pontibacter vulgaris]
MKDILKDYGTIIGPLTAFGFGVMALYIKYGIDRKLDEWKTKTKLSKLIQLIGQSTPPNTHYPSKSENGFYANELRNLTNISIFSKRLNVISMFIEKIESDILIHSSLKEVQQFHHIKFIVKYMNERLEKIRDRRGDKESLGSEFQFPVISKDEFYAMSSDYERLLKVCNDPDSEFKYVDSKIGL